MYTRLLASNSSGRLTQMHTRLFRFEFVRPSNIDVHTPFRFESARPSNIYVHTPFRFESGRPSNIDVRTPIRFESVRPFTIYVHTPLRFKSARPSTMYVHTPLRFESACTYDVMHHLREYLQYSVKAVCCDLFGHLSLSPFRFESARPSNIYVHTPFRFESARPFSTYPRIKQTLCHTLDNKTKAFSHA